MVVRIVVRGVPAPQGSKRHVGNGIMVESSKAVGPWREAVRAETQRVTAAEGTIAGAVDAEIGFSIPRPKSLPKRVVYVTKRPDLDKLVRAVLDGLTAGGAWLDDAQVVTMATWKSYATPEWPAGCYINLTMLEA